MKNHISHAKVDWNQTGHWHICFHYFEIYYCEKWIGLLYPFFQAIIVTTVFLSLAFFFSFRWLNNIGNVFVMIARHLKKGVPQQRLQLFFFPHICLNCIKPYFPLYAINKMANDEIRNWAIRITRSIWTWKTIKALISPPI